jgi:phosphoribosylformylglycinamidine synthase
MAEACRAFETPIVSGNVSFYNETDGRSIFPTPTIAMVGLVPELRVRVSSGFQSEGDLVVLLGVHEPVLDGSEYLKVIHGLVKGRPAPVDLDQEQRLVSLCREAVREGVLSSAHDVSDGGLAVALAESCFHGRPGAKGARVRIAGNCRTDQALFGEAAGGIIGSVGPGAMDLLREKGERSGVSVQVLGRVGGERLEFEGIASWETAELERIWSGALARMMGE